MRVVFMGTPDYAAVTLKALISAGYDICAVFCQPDKPVGRKRILTPPPVKVCAEENSLTVFQPETLRDGTAIEILKRLNPDIIVVVAYGKILPKEILDIPRFGCVNAHASLLPKYRGASPIQWAIVNGESVTGVTTMYMDEGMDTGDILETVSVDIKPEETAEQLFYRLSIISAELTVLTLDKIEKGTLKSRPQPSDGASYAPIIKKEMARLDFNKTADELHNAVRGYYSWPCAFFELSGKRIKVIASRVGAATDKPVGTVVKADDELVIACGGGTTLRLLEVQPEGGRVMTSKQMLCGNKIEPGTVIEG